MAECLVKEDSYGFTKVENWKADVKSQAYDITRSAGVNLSYVYIAKRGGIAQMRVVFSCSGASLDSTLLEFKLPEEYAPFMDIRTQGFLVYGSDGDMYPISINYIPIQNYGLYSIIAKKAIPSGVYIAHSTHLVYILKDSE